jgi:hypothetical protein
MRSLKATSLALGLAGVTAGAILWSCDGSGESGGSPTGPAPDIRQVVVRFRSVFPAETPCGTASLAGTSAAVCAGDSLVVRGVPEAAELRVTGAALVRYATLIDPGAEVTAWLLPRARGEVLEYVQELVNASGSRPFPFGFASRAVPVESNGLDPLQASALREVVGRLDGALAPLVGGSYFELVAEPDAQGVRAVSVELAGLPARTFAETFDEAHKIVCRIELDADLAPGPGLSSRIAHELGHCLGLARHDPRDRPDRIMNRLAPGEYWEQSSGLNAFDSGVFALAVLASENEIDLTAFR